MQPSKTHYNLYLEKVCIPELVNYNIWADLERTTYKFIKMHH